MRSDRAPAKARPAASRARPLPASCSRGGGGPAAALGATRRVPRRLDEPWARLTGAAAGASDARPATTCCIIGW